MKSHTCLPLTGLILLAFLGACKDGHSSDKTKQPEKKGEKSSPYMTDTASRKGIKPDKLKPYTPKPKEELKKTLTDIQYRVTQEEGTERSFRNEYWDNKRPGIYVDVISGRPLFSSTAKFDSGTGWPSFYEPLHKEEVTTKVDRGLFSERVEVRSTAADAHLGHVFDDVPDQPTGLRYCMNSAALRFVPLEDLEKEGLGEYKKLFEGTKEAAAKPAAPEKK